MSPDDKGIVDGLRCSFCGKSQEQVGKLVFGPNGIFICDECVMLCVEIISESQLSLRIASFLFLAVAKTGSACVGCSALKEVPGARSAAPARRGYFVKNSVTIFVNSAGFSNCGK
jgi:hypothetical protein